MPVPAWCLTGNQCPHIQITNCNKGNWTCTQAWMSLFQLVFFEVSVSTSKVLHTLNSKLCTTGDLKWRQVPPCSLYTMQMSCMPCKYFSCVCSIATKLVHSILQGIQAFVKVIRVRSASVPAWESTRVDSSLLFWLEPQSFNSCSS